MEFLQGTKRQIASWPNSTSTNCPILNKSSRNNNNSNAITIQDVLSKESTYVYKLQLIHFLIGIYEFLIDQTRLTSTNEHTTVSSTTTTTLFWLSNWHDRTEQGISKMTGTENDCFRRQCWTNSFSKKKVGSCWKLSCLISRRVEEKKRRKMLKTSKNVEKCWKTSKNAEKRRNMLLPTIGWDDYEILQETIPNSN